MSDGSTMDKLEIVLNWETENENAIEDAISTLKTIEEMADSVSTALGEMSDNLDHASKSISNLTSSAMQIDEEFASKFDNIQLKVSVETDKPTLDIPTIQAEPDKVAPKLVDNESVKGINQLLEKMPKLNKLIQEATRVSGLLSNELKKVSTSLGVPKVINAISKSTNFLKARFNALKLSIDDNKKSFEKFKAILSGVRGLFSTVGKGAMGFLRIVDGGLIDSITNLTKRVRGFIRALGRVAIYRAVRLFLSEFTKGAIAGTKAVYEFAKIMDLQLRKSMDSLTTSMFYFGNSLGAVIKPILNALAPAVDFLIDKIVGLLNVLNQAIARLSGKNEWTKAVKVQKEYASALEESKKHQQALMGGFDELNILQEPSVDLDIPDYGSMFEQMETDTSIYGWLDEVKQSVIDSDWEKVGFIIGDKINKSFRTIDFNAIGERIGKGTQNVILTLYTLLSTINFVEIGKQIGNSFGKLFDQLDFGTLGRLFAMKWAILVDFIDGLVNATKWKEMGDNISNFINSWFDEIDLGNVGRVISDSVLGIFTTLKTTFENLNWGEIGRAFGDGIESIKWREIFNTVANTISSLVGGLLTFLTEGVKRIQWADLGNSIGEGLAKIDWFGLLEKLIIAVGNVLVGLFEFIVGFAIGLMGNLWDNIKGYFDEKFGWFFQGVREAGSVLLEAGGVFFSTLGTLFKMGIDGIIEIVKFVITAIPKLVTTMFVNVLGVFGVSSELLSKIWVELWEKISEGAKKAFDNISNWVGKIVNGVIEAMNFMIRALNRLKFSVPDWVPVIGGKDFGFNISEIKTMSIKAYEHGGLPPKGEMFIANEKSIEMIGSMDNKPVVANNELIIQGIKQGVREAMIDVLTQHGDKDQEFHIHNTIELENDVLYKGVQKEKVRRGVDFGMGVFVR